MKRIIIEVPDELLRQFDAHTEHVYGSRAEAIRDLMRTAIMPHPFSHAARREPT